MAEQFDLVTWMKDFEQINGRPPTPQEAENARALLERYTVTDSMEDVSSNQTAYWNKEEPAGTVTAYKPKTANRWKAIGAKGLSWFWKALLGIFLTPVYLTMFVFNLIKSTIGVFIIWFVTKIMLLFLLGILAELTGNGEHPNSFFRWAVNLLIKPDGNPFPHPVFDAWLIGIATVILALVMTFSRYDEY